MCGIAGALTFGGPDPAVAERDVRRMVSALGHRGPDGEGVYASPDRSSALGHRRLAIIDLSEGGRQPMSDAEGRRWLVYNGEIYNHHELRRELASEGYAFRTRSDTEVLLGLLVRRGPAALERVRGMFAFALWDERDRELLIGRDRFGMKPMYVGEREDGLVLCSELGAMATVLPRAEASVAGVLGYLRWGTVPSPLTWLEGVRALPPACWERWGAAGRVASGRFADVRDTFGSSGDAPAGATGDLVADVAEAFRESVRAHLESDVPVGLFLSSGVDSSAIASAVRSLGRTDLACFTVTFPEREFAEDVLAGEVARSFGLSHRVLSVDGAALLRDLPRVLDALDQPTVDGVNSYLVSRAVAETGIKVVLSGAGGDECFAGYASFRQLPAMRRWRWVLGTVGRWAGPMLPARRRAKWRHVCRARGRLSELHRARRGLFMPDELGALVGERFSEGSFRESLERVEAVEREALAPTKMAEAPVAAVSRMETVQYLGWQLLRDTDAVAMAHSLEVRLPFVDHALLRAVWPALARHPSLLEGKRLLRDGLSLPLPAGVARGGKRSFTLPMEAWLRGPLAGTARDLLRAVAADGWIGLAAAARLWQDFVEGRVHWSRVWALVVLGHFVARLASRRAAS